MASQITMCNTSAGIFTKPPPEEEAVATMAGLVLNCANSALYMANYNLVVRLLLPSLGRQSIVLL